MHDRRAKLWDDDDGTDARAIPITIEELQAKQLAGDAATVDMLLGSQGLQFSDRARAWLAWSGAADNRNQFSPDHYAKLKEKFSQYQREQPHAGASSASSSHDAPSPSNPFTKSFKKSMDTIGRDLKRTCQEHQYFSDADGLACLERILATSLLHKPALGYTQGMNYLAAFLLLTLQLGDDDEDKENQSRSTTQEALPQVNGGCSSSVQTGASKTTSAAHKVAHPEEFLGSGHVTAANIEEDAFWIFNGMLQRFEGYFSAGFPMLTRDTAILATLLRETEPTLKQHLEASNVNLLMYTPKWLICFWLNSLPGHVVVRVWDLVLFYSHCQGDSEKTSSKKEAEVCCSGGGNGVLLWVALSVLHGLAHRLIACRDFEAVTVCLKKGLGRLQSFSWLKRHAPSPLQDLVCDVRKRIVKADQSSEAIPVNTESGVAALLHAPSSHSHSRDWFVSCPSERQFLVGLASAKTSAAELRLTTGDRPQANGHSSPGNQSSAISFADCVVIEDYHSDHQQAVVADKDQKGGGYNDDDDDEDEFDEHDPFGDAYEKGHDDDQSLCSDDEEDDAETSMLSPVKLVNPRSVRKSERKERRMSITGEIADEVMGGILGLSSDDQGTNRCMGLLLATDDEDIERIADPTITLTFNDPSSPSQAVNQGTLAAEALSDRDADVANPIDPKTKSSSSSTRTVLSFMREAGLAALPLPLALRAFLEKAMLPVGDVAKAHRVLRAFATAYVELQAPPSVQRKSNKTDATYVAALEPNVFHTVEASFVLSCALVILSANLHDPTIKSSNRISSEAFAQQVSWAMKSSNGSGTTTNSSSNDVDDAVRSTLDDAYADVARKPVLVTHAPADSYGRGGKPGRSSSSSSSTSMESAFLGSMSFLQNAFAGTPLKQSAYISAAPQQPTPSKSGTNNNATSSAIKFTWQSAAKDKFSSAISALGSTPLGKPPAPPAFDAFSPTISPPSQRKRGFGELLSSEMGLASTTGSVIKNRGEGSNSMGPPPSSAKRPRSSASRPAPVAIEMKATPRRSSTARKGAKNKKSRHSAGGVSMLQSPLRSPSSRAKVPSSRGFTPARRV